MKSPLVYQHCVENVFGNEVIVPKVDNYVPLNQNNRLENVYVKAQRVPMNAKLKEFQFKFLHDALVL